MPEAKIKYLTYEQIRLIHLTLVDEFFDRYKSETTRYGILNDAIIHAAVNRPRATFDGHDLYPSIPYKAAALMHSIIKGHPFVDANKRTGILSGWLFLSLNGVVATLNQDHLYELALDVEADRYDLPALGSILSAFFVPLS